MRSVTYQAKDFNESSVSETYVRATKFGYKIVDVNGGGYTIREIDADESEIPADVRAKADELYMQAQSYVLMEKT